MPPLETDCRKQDAVLWMATGFDEYGQATVAAEVPIKVRQQAGKKEAIDPNGNVVAVDSVGVVDRVITVGSIIWFGNIDDIATPPVDLLEVITSSEIPDVKGRWKRRTIGVMRYSNELPAFT